MRAAPKILLDLTPLVTPSSLRGIGRYTRGLVQGLCELPADERLDVVGLAASTSVLSLEVVNDIAEYCKRPAHRPHQFAAFLRNQQAGGPAQRVARRERRLLHLTDPKGHPLKTITPYTLTCFDLIPLVLHQDYLPKIPKWDQVYRSILLWRYRLPLRILTISHATKRDMCERLGVPAQQIDVAWLGVDHDVYHPRAEEGESEQVSRAIGEGPYVLYIGAGDARRDLITLITAFSLAKLGKEARLVIAGKLDPPRVKSLREHASKLGVGARVLVAGYVEEALVPALYRQAAVHVFPSRYEGFGLPVLEALACGAPTITSPGSSLDEVAGDAALIIPCGEPEALAVGLDGLFYDRERVRQLRERGLQRAGEFTWRACAAGTVAFWRRAGQG